MKSNVAILLFLLLTGCELIVDIDVPFPQAQITLNSFFHADSLWVASLSENQSILDTSPRKRIGNGLVVIYQGDTPIDTLQHIESGVYRSDKGKPVPGQQYEIRAAAEGYLSVRGRSHIPLPATVTQVNIIDRTTPEGYPESSIRISFADDPQAANFYQIFLEVETERVDRDGEVRVFRNRLGIESDDPTVQNNDEIGYDGLFMKDILFNGGEGVISLTTPGQHIQYFQQVIVTLRTLSEDYYNYKITGSLQENTSDNPFAQPVNVHDNIDDGFGIFAGYSEYGYTIGEVAPRPVIHSISPIQGKPGDHVIITGENFWDLSSDFGVVIFTGQLNTVPARVVRATPNELEVVIPDNAVTGKIYVGYRNKIGSSGEAFEIMD